MNDRNQLTEELGHELRTRADEVYGAPFTLDDVRGRARSIRRGRIAVAAGALAAAVAVVAVAPTALSGGLDRADRPQPAQPAPSGTAHGAVLHDGVVTLADGTTVTLDVPTRGVSQLGVLTDGRLVLAEPAKRAIQVLHPDGSLEATHRVDTVALTMSATDELAAWTEGSRVQVLESGSPEPVALAHMPVSAGTIPMVDAVTGDHCADGGCWAILSDGTTTTSEVSVDGLRPVATGEPLRVTDVSPDGGTWAVAFPAPEGQQVPCVGLYDRAAARVHARSCAAGGLDFAPDGRHLLAVSYENNMAGRLTVLDRALEVVSRFEPPAGEAVSRAAWADDGHVLAALADPAGHRWSLVRVALDGVPETLASSGPGVDPERGSDYLPSE